MEDTKIYNNNNDHSNNSSDETTRLVNDNTRSNSQPIPANRLALDAQIQAASEYQRRLRRRRSVYYIVLITSVTMLIFCILSFVAWIIHNSSGKGHLVEAKTSSSDSLMIETVETSLENIQPLNHFNARKHPTRTIKPEEDSSSPPPAAAAVAVKNSNLMKRSEMDSDLEDKDEELNPDKQAKVRKPTRTRKLSFAPEKVIDYKAANI